ncbi:MAG TPA: LPS assembly lipoprotein LptE [Opitutaceae bacterium]|jgi:PBP1b-binding outer membrane lipoprotein LpoB|nr:LPS assembly lipoprotein LptE [Opitutaceae bacterium]
MKRAILAIGLLLAGCAHYQLGTTGQLAFSTLFVAPVVNKTLQPQLIAPMSVILRDAFNHDGRVTLVDSPQAADATLQVVITGYRRDVAAVREQDTGLASKFTVYMTAKCTLIDNRSQRALFADRLIVVSRDVFTDRGDPHSSLVSNQLQAEYNLIPQLGEDLAKQVTHAVLDVW